MTKQNGANESSSSVALHVGAATGGGLLLFFSLLLGIFCSYHKRRLSLSANPAGKKLLQTGGKSSGDLFYSTSRADDIVDLVRMIDLQLGKYPGNEGSPNSYHVKSFALKPSCRSCYGYISLNDQAKRQSKTLHGSLNIMSL